MRPIEAHPFVFSGRNQESGPAFSFVFFLALALSDQIVIPAAIPASPHRKKASR
jgi:hypothetical protein